MRKLLIILISLAVLQILSTTVSFADDGLCTIVDRRDNPPRVSVENKATLADCNNAAQGRITVQWFPPEAKGVNCSSSNSTIPRSGNFICDSPPDWALGQNCDVATTPVTRFICHRPGVALPLNLSGLPNGICTVVDSSKNPPDVYKMGVKTISECNAEIAGETSKTIQWFPPEAMDKNCSSSNPAIPQSGQFQCLQPPNWALGRNCDVVNTNPIVRFVCHTPGVALSRPENSPTPAPIASYNLLAPLKNPFDGTDLKNIPVGGENALGNYLNVIIRLGIGLAAVLAVVLIVMGGIQYMTTELMSGKQEGIHKMTNAVLGLLVALGAYLILYTIDPALLKIEPTIPKTELQYVEDAPQAAVDGKYTYNAPGDVPADADWIAMSPGIPALPSGVTVKTPECTKVGQQDCTSVRGLNPSYVATIRTRCGDQCELTITGGTEFWLHKIGTRHRPGNPTIDLRSTNTPNLNRYITGGQPLVQRWYDRDGLRFLFEGDHWHVE